MHQDCDHQGQHRQGSLEVQVVVLILQTHAWVLHGIRNCYTLISLTDSDSQVVLYSTAHDIQHLFPVDSVSNVVRLCILGHLHNFVVDIPTADSKFHRVDYPVVIS